MCITCWSRYAAEKGNSEMGKLLLNQATQQCEVNYIDSKTGEKDNSYVIIYHL